MYGRKNHRLERECENCYTEFTPFRRRQRLCSRCEQFENSAYVSGREEVGFRW